MKMFGLVFIFSGNATARKRIIRKTTRAQNS